MNGCEKEGDEWKNTKEEKVRDTKSSLIQCSKRFKLHPFFFIFRANCFWERSRKELLESYWTYNEGYPPDEDIECFCHHILVGNIRIVGVNSR